MDEEPQIIFTFFNSPVEEEQIAYGLAANYTLWRWVIGVDKKWEKIAGNARRVVWPDMREVPKEKLNINDVHAILMRQAKL